MRSVLRAGRYEIHNATMVDLIRIAYSVDADNVVGGPSWLEYDRFDVIAKAPPNSTPEKLKPMLQGLLADRFKLAIHNDTRPIPGYVLASGKGKPKLKEAEPSGRSGCEMQPLPRSAAPTPGQFVIPTTALSCHNITMEAFATSLRGMADAYFRTPVTDSTGLKGSWDFDLKWTPKIVLYLAGADGITIFDAVDKQLGLKLEEQNVLVPAIVVDQVNKKPTDNVANVEAKLPPPPPAEFEVATVKPSEPGLVMANGLGFFGFLPGGRVNLPKLPLRFIISLAWNVPLSDEIVNAPKWLDGTVYDIAAKVPADAAPVGGTGSFEDLGPMLQSLLKDRFKMQAHYEDRQVTAYTLAAAKPKLKKADPLTRTGCKLENATTMTVNTGNFSVAGRQVTCKNMTMAQFADQLQTMAANYVHYPVLDATGLDGAWDFSFSYSSIAPAQAGGLRGAPAGADLGASDPTGGVSLFDAVEKQLGLKLEAQKRSHPVFVIDHIEEKPTDN
jgi:uncharacterized protein (TIGR03435 family)